MWLPMRKDRNAKGLIEKQMRFAGKRIDLDITFHWQDWGKRRAAAEPFHPVARRFLLLDRLTLATSNGGAREIFSLDGRIIDHGAPVSFLVSSSHGFWND